MSVDPLALVFRVAGAFGVASAQYAAQRSSELQPVLRLGPPRLNMVWDVTPWRLEKCPLGDIVETCRNEESEQRLELWWRLLD